MLPCLWLYLATGIGLGFLCEKMNAKKNIGISPFMFVVFYIVMALFWPLVLYVICMKEGK